METLSGAKPGGKPNETATVAKPGDKQNETPADEAVTNSSASIAGSASDALNAAASGLT